ncbi:cadherin-23-like [Mytilus trossulus]|uniref:cadherin-23-like n=1 Tax=Mytilus trossulus TaxID=6551 RepID=UPI0030069D68
MGLSAQSIQEPRWNDDIHKTYLKPENLSPGSALVTISAEGQNGVEVTLTTYGKETERRVYFNFTTNGITSVGTVYLKEEMDREEKGEWELYFKAYDSKIRVDEVREVKLTIYITDVNDNAPKFIEPMYQQDIPENENVSTEVLKVVATDPDNSIGGIVRYSLQPEGQSAGLYDNAFTIDARSGSVTLGKRLEFAKLSFYQYILIGTDGEGLQGNATLIIKIQDVQNKPPYFTGQPFNAEIPEESPVGTTVKFVYPIRADDGDTSVPHDIEYRFTEGVCNEFFEIKSNGMHGIVTVKKRIDRDHGVIHNVRGVCTMTLMALEKVNSGETNPGPSNATTPVVITIIDIDDSLPEFSQSLYNATVFENLTQVAFTLKGDGINVSDADQDVNSRLHLELRYHNGSLVQGIKPVPDTVQDSGNIMLYLQDDFSFDFEKVQEVSFMLGATEEKDQPYTTQCIVYLTIINRNDNFPQFTKSSFAVHIVENYTNEQPVLSEKATDKDSGYFGEITYSLQDSRDIFIVNNLTGVITKRKNVILDYEKIDEYVLILLAKDGGGNLQSAEVVVTLDDVNDNPPVFLQSFYNGVIKETDKNFKLTVSAFDRDQRNTSNSRVEFVLIDSPFNMQNNFTITTTWQNGEYLGNISLTESLDFTKINKTTIELHIKAKDFGSPSLSSTTTITLNIQINQDKNREVFVQMITGFFLQASETPKYHCMCGSALTSLLATTMTPTCNATRYPPGNEIAETEKFMFRYEPNSHVMVAITHHECYVYSMSDTESVDVHTSQGLHQLETKIISMVDSTTATYVTMSHDELTSLSKSSARTCNRVGWTTHKLNID